SSGLLPSHRSPREFACRECSHPGSCPRERCLSVLFGTQERVDLPPVTHTTSSLPVHVVFNLGRLFTGGSCTVAVPLQYVEAARSSKRQAAPALPRRPSRSDDVPSQRFIGGHGDCDVVRIHRRESDGHHLADEEAGGERAWA